MNSEKAPPKESYSYYEPDKKPVYQIIKVCITSSILIFFILTLWQSRVEGFIKNSFFIIAALCFASIIALLILQAFKAIFTRKEKLLFFEINSDAVSFGYQEGGLVTSLRSSALDLVIIDTSRIQLSISGKQEIMEINIPYEIGTQDMVTLFQRIAPQALLKDRTAFGEDPLD